MAYIGTPIDTTNQFQSLQGKRFSGDGSTTAFTLDIAPSSVFDIEVFVENVRQDPNSAYGISGTTLTFTGAPPSGTNNIYVVHQAKAVGTIDVPASGVVPASLASNIISGQTALAAVPAATDELLISDAGTIKRIDAQFFQNTPAFMARMSADQSISSNTNTKVDFDTEVFDTDSAYDHSTNQRFTVPSGMGGKYYITCTLGTDDGNEGSVFVVNIYKNGSNEGESSYNRIQRTSGVLSFDAHTIIDLSAGDYIEIYARHETAVNLQPGINSGEFRSRFGGFKLT